MYFCNEGLNLTLRLPKPFQPSGDDARLESAKWCHCNCSYSDILETIAYRHTTSPVTTAGSGGFSPPNSPNWKLKHYKSMVLYLIVRCQAPLHKRKAPLLKTFLRRFCTQNNRPEKKLLVLIFILSKRKSCNRNFHISSYETVNMCHTIAE